MRLKNCMRGPSLNARTAHFHVLAHALPHSSELELQLICQCVRLHTQEAQQQASDPRFRVREQRA
jgi:hypothetical protein